MLLTCRVCGCLRTPDNTRPTASGNLRGECTECELAENRRRYHRRKSVYDAKKREYLKANRHISRIPKAASEARRRQRRTSRPPWADQKKIIEFYQLAAWFRKQGVRVEVDHIVPLLGKTVCGLHVQTNLRVVTTTSNRKKSNRRWPDAPE